MLPDYNAIFDKYNNQLKPLISEIEGREERFCHPLLDRLAGVFDYLALADLDDPNTESYIGEADCLLDECLSISYSNLVGIINRGLRKFERTVGKRGLKKLDKGRFIGKYQALRDDLRGDQKELKQNGFKRRLKKNERKELIENLPTLKNMYKTISKMEKLAIKEIPNISLEKSESLTFIANLFRWLIALAISVLCGVVWAFFNK